MKKIQNQIILLILSMATLVFSTSLLYAGNTVRENKGAENYWCNLSADDQAFLENVQRLAFDYFWEGFDPVTGLIVDKTKGTRTSIASSGFGLSAYVIGVENGWVAKEEAYRRILITLNSYYKNTNNATDLCVDGKYGFVDSFNPSQNWYVDSFPGIDKGNEVLMIQNFKNGGVWKTFMQNPFVKEGMKKAKFTRIKQI